MNVLAHVFTAEQDMLEGVLVPGWWGGRGPVPPVGNGFLPFNAGGTFWAHYSLIRRMQTNSVLL